jgi:hypothetical protein
MFFVSIFSCAQLRIASSHFRFRCTILVSLLGSCGSFITTAPFHLGEGYSRPPPILQMVLSLVGRPCCCSATSSATLNTSTGRGGPASYMGYPLPRAPGSVGRKPCGQGSPRLRPDGAGQLGGLKSSTQGTETTTTRTEIAPLSPSNR